MGILEIGGAQTFNQPAFPEVLEAFPAQFQTDVFRKSRFVYCRLSFPQMFRSSILLFLFPLFTLICTTIIHFSQSSFSLLLSTLLYHLTLSYSPFSLYSRTLVWVSYKSASMDDKRQDFILIDNRARFLFWISGIVCSILHEYFLLHFQPHDTDWSDASSPLRVRCSAPSCSICSRQYGIQWSQVSLHHCSTEKFTISKSDPNPPQSKPKRPLRPKLLLKSEFGKMLSATIIRSLVSVIENA